LLLVVALGFRLVEGGLGLLSPFFDLVAGGIVFYLRLPEGGIGCVSFTFELFCKFAVLLAQVFEPLPKVF
jgi:hypothetical protein